MSPKPDPSLPNDGLSIRKKPITAGEKRAIANTLKSLIPPESIVKGLKSLPIRVPTTCVACGKEGVPRSLYPREALAFMWAHVQREKLRPPYYGACGDHGEIVQGIAASYEPTREERFILECCRRAGVDPMPLLLVKIARVRDHLLKVTRKDAKQIHFRLDVFLWARKTYPDATWKELAPRLGYRTADAARKAYLRARQEQGETKPRK